MKDSYLSTAIRVAIFLPLLLMFSCNEGKLEELAEEVMALEEELGSCRSEFEELEEKLEQLEELANRVESSYMDLESEVGDFGFEDWEYNVPDVQDATEELYYSIRNLRNEF
jgi:predicted nuclease with TOPRIM domain